MAKFFPFIRRIISGGGAPPAAGFIASVVQVGISFLNRFTLLGGTVLPAFTIDATRQALRISQTPAIDTGLLGVDGTAAQQLVNPAIDIDARVDSAQVGKPAVNVAVDTDLLGVVGTAVQQIVNPTFDIDSRVDSAEVGKPAVNAAVDIDSRVDSAQLSKPVVNAGVDTDLLGANGTAAFPAHTPGINTALLSINGTASNEAHTPAVGVSARISEYHLDALPAANITQVTYNLTRLVGANVASNSVGTWTNPTGAQSAHNGTTATSAGAALAGSRKLQLAYANHVNKGELAITQVKLFLYAAVTGDATGLLSTTTVTYDIGAGEVTLEIIAGNFANLTTPREYDLTGLLDNWTEYNALTVFVNHAFAAASVGVSCAVDACEVEVLANKTDTL